MRGMLQTRHLMVVGWRSTRLLWGLCMWSPSATPGEGNTPHERDHVSGTADARGAVVAEASDQVERRPDRVGKLDFLRGLEVSDPVPERRDRYGQDVVAADDAFSVEAVGGSDPHFRG